ncbi:MAG: CDP-alcohol phosphatidyltransferase family protein [Hydrocarboniphaga effusa]|nr:CDP-alcohol phosphatidyltransferase family protein [Hydrocarboniphaga effusa]
MLTIVGDCDQRLFGMTPAERLSRQAPRLGDLHLVAHASAVLSDDTVSWLAAHPGTIVASAEGRPLAVAVKAGDLDSAKAAIGGAHSAMTVARADAIGPVYVRKLRRTLKPLALALGEQSKDSVERKLFASVYKGVTDLVTKFAWPEPALWLTRAAAALGLAPNAVTVIGLVLTLIAGWQFYVGNLAIGLFAAWLMTLLDTVDGKLARVTLTSSQLGNLLDHGNDILHPPIWWYCLAHGIAVTSAAAAPQLWLAFWVILGCYVASRAIETSFRLKFGFNPFMWTPFDSRFRLIISRRNVILLLMTVGLALGIAHEAYLACALWSIVSTLFQLFRLGQAFAIGRSQSIRPWLS